MKRTRTIRLERTNDVLARTGLSRSTLERLVAAGEFPRPVKIADRAKGFVTAEVDRYLRERIRASRSPLAAA